MPKVKGISNNSKSLQTNPIQEGTLKEKFKKNGLPYTLIRCNEVAAMYGVGGTFTDEILHYEVFELHFRKARIFRGKSFPDEYVLPSNEQFGKDKSRAILKHGDALLYFDAMTRELRQKSSTVETNSLQAVDSATLIPIPLL
jgi:hypothetical protein